MKNARKSSTGNNVNLIVIEQQLKQLNHSEKFIPSFIQTLQKHGSYPLQTSKLEVLQINLGYQCNQVCAHCHVDAGPDRKEMMSKEIMHHCLRVIDTCGVNTVDLTGGAPEMNPYFKWFVEQISKRKIKIIVRSNLTILVSNKKYNEYPDFFCQYQVEVIASLPCYSEKNTDEQRGAGVFNDSIKALKRLNSLGYGNILSGLKLHLVFNPSGTDLSPNQEQLEQDFKKHLSSQYDVIFNHLYTINNQPISRFLEYLINNNQYESYMKKLFDHFNADVIPDLMCRKTLSVRWDGTLYHCDFNQILNLKANLSSQSIVDYLSNHFENRSITLNQHCYACTGGSGSSCQGSLNKL